MGKKRVRFTLPEEPLLDQILRTQAELFKRRLTRPAPLPRPPPRTLHPEPSEALRISGQGYMLLDPPTPHIGYWGRDV